VMNDRRLAQGRQRERILALTPANGPLFSTFAGIAHLASETVDSGKRALTLESLEKEITAFLAEDCGIQTLREKSYTRQPGARKGSGTGAPAVPSTRDERLPASSPAPVSALATGSAARQQPGDHPPSPSSFRLCEEGGKPGPPGPSSKR
jgi:hypothetical protein